MRSLGSLPTLLRETIAEWQSFRLADLGFWHGDDVRLVVVALAALALGMLVIRTLVRRRSPRHGVVLPALLASVPRSRAAYVVHLPVALFFAGLPFFLLALADPFTALVSRQVSYPGRRIGIMIDASVSMRLPFAGSTLDEGARTSGVFFTTVAAAEEFIQLRMKGQYRDLIGVIEFGNDAYVIMPFTSDYDNVLLSVSLIGDPEEFGRFPSQGTTITRAINETVGLFKTFNFLDASGNLMIIFSDGEDSTFETGTVRLDDIVQTAIDAEIPLYFVRMTARKEPPPAARGAARGPARAPAEPPPPPPAAPTPGVASIADERWADAVRKTGGQFYPVVDDGSLRRAIRDIDRLAGGTIAFRQYTNQEPRFAAFALIAAGLWAAAAGAKLTLPYFQKLS